jgi:hypothetical protein
MARNEVAIQSIHPQTGVLVVAVQLESDFWCYVREYVLCHGFLPFFSASPLSTEDVPNPKGHFVF